MYRRILLAYDGSESGQRALLDSREIAQWSNAELFLVAVMPPLASTYVPAEGVFYEDPSREDTDRKRFEGILADGLRRLSDAGFATRGEVVVGDPVHAITQHARNIAADLIVVGHRHHESWAERWWRGSTARALIEHAHCSVLVVITR